MSRAALNLRMARVRTPLLEGNYVTSCQETAEEDAEAQG